MENINLADDAARGVADISGVKDTAFSLPEKEGAVFPSVADSEEKTELSGEISVVGAIEIDDGAADELTLEKEFDALINGKYRDAYKKRTEGIIRRRLRSGKARPIADAVIPTATEPSASDTSVANESHDAAMQRLRAQNKKRPIENGLSGSCGIVTKINVSALDGKGVLAILKRVGTGEKISFK